MTPTEAVNYLAQVTPTLPVPLPVHQQVLMALEVLRRELQPKAQTLVPGSSGVKNQDTASYSTVEVKMP